MDLIPTIISSAVLILGSWLTYRASVTGKRREVEAAPYPELAKRVDHLEQQVGALYRSQHEDRNYIRVLLTERPRDLPWPRPFPSWLADPTSSLTPSSIIQPPVVPRGPIDNP